MKFKFLYFLFLTLTTTLFGQSFTSIYSEEFNSTNGWPTGNNDTRELYVSNGKYYFEYKKDADWRVSSTSFSLDESKDFEISTSIQKISGEQDYGMSFFYDFKDDDNYREFGITATGYYRVAESKSGTYKNIQSWVKSSLIKTGNYQTHDLKVVKKGNTLSFYINNTFVYSTTHEKFMGDKVGFRLYKKQKVAIDYFRVSQASSNNNTNNNYVSKSILFEGFNNNENNWNSTDPSSADVYVTNGDLIINHKRSTGGWVPTIYKPFDTSRDFYITAQFKHLSGITNNGFGLAFGRKDKDNENLFFITAGGSYNINVTENGSKQYLQNWTSSSSIKTGSNAINFLKVEKVGNTLKYSINNDVVYTNYNPKFFGDYTGFVVYDNQKIEIAYLSMMYTDDGNNNNNNNNYNNNNNNNNSNNYSQSIIDDDFNNNENHWATSNNGESVLEISNGKYYFEYTGSKGWTTTKSVYVDTNKDYAIETDIQKISGTQTNGYGLVFNRLDSDNQYQFIITGNGNFAIDNYKDGKFSSVVDWTKTDAIRTGNYATNNLKIEKTGSSYKFFVNNSLVYTAYNLASYGSRYGFSIFDPQKIAIDNFKMAYIGSSNNNTVDNISNETYSDSGYDFSDQFNNNNNKWQIGKKYDYDFRVENGKLYLNHKKDEKGYTSIIDNYIDTSKDFEIETKIDKISGVINHGYGFVFGKSGNSDFRFYLASNGYYKVVRLVNDKEQEIQKWVQSSYVNQNNGKSNTIKVKKEGSFYKFYINNNFVYQTDFEAFYGNQMGYVVYNNQEIAVDYLRFKYISSSNNNNNTYVSNTLKLPISEQFNSNANGWYTGNFENYTTDITNGKLNLHRTQKGGVFVSKDVDIDTSKDFIIETAISTQKEGASGLYGVTFGRENSSNEFSFLLSTNGSYMFRKFDKNEYHKIIPFTNNEAIKTNVGDKNVVKIAKSGSLLRFFVNDVFLNEVPFEPFYGNKLGYTIYYEQKIAVDYLEVKYQSNSTFNNPPIVVITEPIVEAERGFKIVEANSITVRGKATDEDGIFEVTVNDKPVVVNADGTFYGNVLLKYGENILEVKVTDLKQAVATKTFKINRKSSVTDNTTVVIDNKKNEEKINIGFGKYYALIIGVSQYDDDKIADLQGEPTKDAQALHDLLISKYTFLKENITLLKNPTDSEINRSFYQLRQKVGPQDNLLIFYAGHGNYDELSERGYWMPSNTNMEFEDNIILNTTVLSHINAINSKHTLLISDACFSGSIMRGPTAKEESMAQKLYSLKSRKGLTSGTLTTVPNKSVFMKYLLDKLTTNQNKYLTSNELFSLINIPVLNNSDNVPQRGVLPKTGDEGGDFIFITK